MTEEETQSIVEHEKKKKKRKKIKDEEILRDEQNTQMEEEENQINVEEAKEKTKKKKRKKIVLEEEDTNPKFIEETDEKRKEIEIIKVKTEIVPENAEKIAPIVGYFPSGYNPLKDEDGPQVVTYRRRPSRLQLVVSPKGSKVDFVGSSHSVEAEAAQICSYALGVLDKESKTLKIVRIASNKILRLEPVVGRSNSYDKELPKEVGEGNTIVAKGEKFKALTNRYGTKKKFNEDMKFENIKKAGDAEAQKDLDEKVEGLQLNEEALVNTSGTPARNIPPHDSTADTPERAYPLDRIILNGERDFLLDILQLVQSGASISPNDYPTFVCNRVHKLMEIQDEEERTERACILSYITHLIKFKDQRSERHGASKYHRIPPILNTKFLSMFTDSEKYSPPIEKRNLLISYVLVLTLIFDGYKTQISDIVKDLKESPALIRDHYVNLGCKYKCEAKSIFYTLPTPLVFPKIKRQRRRK